MKPARWREQPRETGLRSIGQSPRGYDLRRDGIELLYVRPYGGGATNGPLQGWYWYGLGRHTSREGIKLWKTRDAARADAAAWFKALIETEPHTEGGE